MKRIVVLTKAEEKLLKNFLNIVDDVCEIKAKINDDEYYDLETFSENLYWYFKGEYKDIEGTVIKIEED